MVVDLELEPRDVARALLLALRRVRDTAARSRRSRPVVRLAAQVLVDRHAVGRREVRQLRLAEHERQVAALRDLDACWPAPAAGRRTAPPSRACVLKYCSRREALRRAAGWPASRLRRCRRAPRAPRSRPARGTAPDASRPPAAAARAASCTAARDVRLVVGQAGALHLDVEAPRKQRRPAAARSARRARGVAVQQRLADGAVVGAGQRDQPVGASSSQPCPLRARRWPRCCVAASQARDSSRTGCR